MFRGDHAKLICDVSELSGLFHDAPSMESFLQKITAMVTHHMACEVCSIYLYYEDQNELVLKATKGLHPSSIGNVKLKIGEGLTGLAFKEKRPICEGQVRDNPNFRLFPGIGEEPFESFLAVPILRGAVEIGVMVIQSEKKNYFSPEDIQIFRAITSQLATTIETAKLLITLNDQRQVKPVLAADLKLVKGRCGSQGAVLAEAIVVDALLTDVEHLAKLARPVSEEDFYRAVEETENQLQQLQKQIETNLFDVSALIFTAQILMLKDKGFLDAIVKFIQNGVNPPQAVVHVVGEYVRKFGAITDSYLRDKIYDVKDVGRRLLENMTGLSHHHNDFENRVVIARELLPSDALKLFSQKVKGIILLSGGATSHVSILARSLNIPLVVADEPGLLSLAEGTRVLLDAVMGCIHINPSEDTIKKVFDREDLRKDLDHLKKFIRLRPHTKDGTPVQLMANINLLGDLKAACEFKADGIGLYRSEFPFLIRSSFPSEEEQCVIYRRLIEGMPGKETTLRTLDVGGDKILSYYDYGHEENPFLGLRSIRFSLKHQDVFITQIRAMLRAGHDARLRILFPMISSVDEFQRAKGIVQECIYGLEQEKQKVCHPPLGAMVELPSAVELIDEIADEADFLSIGTNDLVQYLLAVDRTNERVADLYLPHHPSVLRALKKVVDAAIKYGKDVSICGDIAADSKFLPFLLGIGIRSFSVDARYLPKLHQHLADIDLHQAEQSAAQLLKQSKVERTSQLMGLE
ncbi:MAG: phosphoenolpyruvate--protein phosphotransferase [Candidatus Omnitrophica bacterium]|nr:phosphoenolpyruvate--protein phosphotransferase [Candidatus Omnitrophota bacterium]